MAHVRIRFVGEQGKSFHFLKLGPLGNPNPPEREFQGGDIVSVELRPTSGQPGSVDVTFDDGEFAIEVPRDFFEIIDNQIDK